MSAGSTLKSNARVEVLELCEAVAIWRPLIVTATKSGPKPRMAIWLDSPPLRFTDTPGTRCKASATFGSGNLPFSSAEIESTTLTAFCLIDSARWIAASWPVTVIAVRLVAFFLLSVLFVPLPSPLLPVPDDVAAAVLVAAAGALVCACACTL